MKSALIGFKRIAELYGGDRGDLSQLALEYQRTGDSMYLAVVFVEAYPFIVSIVDKYFYLTEEDKASFALQELDKSMNDFKVGQGAILLTFFSRYLNRRLYAETNLLNRHKRSVNNQVVSYEALTDSTVDRMGKPSINVQYVDERFEVIEVLETLESSSALTLNELNYCRIILRNNENVKDSEIARELCVSPSAINQMKKALRRKMLSLELVF